MAGAGPLKKGNEHRRLGVTGRSPRPLDKAVGVQAVRDPLALTVYAEEHSEQEERWGTLGLTEHGRYVVVHAWREVGPTEITVRIISARAAEPEEIRDYQEQPR